MKKLVLASLVALFTATAQADNWYGAVQVENSEDRVTKADSINTAVVVGFKDGDWQYSGKLGTSQAEWGNGSISTSYEGRIKRSFNTMGLKPYLQGRLGEKVGSTSNYSYYAIDAGLLVPVSDRIDVDFSYRYRNAFNTNNNFETDRYGIETKVKLSKVDTVGVRYTQSYGDAKVDAWGLQYTRSF